MWFRSCKKINQFVIICLFVVGREGWRKKWSDAFSPVDYFDMDTGMLVLKVMIPSLASKW